MKKFDYPSKMKAVQLADYDFNIKSAIKNLSIVEIPIPKPTLNQLLIKVEASTCNPSDLAFMRGIYGIKKPVPVVPGREGVGIVVDAFDLSVAGSLIGRRVSFIAEPDSNGTWAEYSLANIKSCISVFPAIPVEQAACMIINPFTAYALVDIVRKKKGFGLIQNAAASQLSDMVRYIAAHFNIDVINIVRKEEHVEKLKASGAKFVLNSDDLMFQEKLSQLSHKLMATTFLDSVGGSLSGIILKAMPSCSEAVVFGSISDETINSISPRDLIFFKKTLRGFILSDWFSNTDYSDFVEIVAFVQDLLLKKGIQTKFQSEGKIEHIQELLTNYTSNLSGGKILIQF